MNIVMDIHSSCIDCYLGNCGSMSVYIDSWIYFCVKVMLLCFHSYSQCMENGYFYVCMYKNNLFYKFVDLTGKELSACTHPIICSDTLVIAIVNDG